MKRTASLYLTVFLFLISFVAYAQNTSENIYNIPVEDIMGNNLTLDKYEGKVLLIVNVASKCAHTPQYKDLQKLYDDYNVEGLEVLAFPANNFMNQEPKDNASIERFCTQKYAITFPMFSKISVKGKNMHPLYKYLTKKEKNGNIDAPVRWNFQKFLVNAEGKVIAWFKPSEKVTDKKILAAIKKELDKTAK